MAVAWREGLRRRVAAGDFPSGVAEMRKVRAGGAADFVGQAAFRRVSFGEREQALGQRQRRRRSRGFDIETSVVRKRRVVTIEDFGGRGPYLVEVSTGFAIAEADLDLSEASERRCWRWTSFAAGARQIGHGWSAVTGSARTVGEGFEFT